MANQSGRRWQALQEQMAMGRAGRHNGYAASSARSGRQGGNEYGQVSIFSKLPQANTSYNPQDPNSTVYLPNTAAGRRMNLRDLQEKIAQARALEAYKQQLITAEPFNQRATTLEKNLDKENDLAHVGAQGEETRKTAQKVEDMRVAEIRRQAQALGRAKGGANLSDAAAEQLGAEITHAKAIQEANVEKAKAPLTQDFANAELGQARVKAMAPVGPAGSVDFSSGQPNANYITPGGNKSTTQTTGEYPEYGPNGEFKGMHPSERTDTIQQTGPVPSKIDLSAYNPETTPGLSSGFQEGKAQGPNEGTGEGTLSVSPRINPGSVGPALNPGMSAFSMPNRSTPLNPNRFSALPSGSVMPLQTTNLSQPITSAAPTAPTPGQPITLPSTPIPGINSLTKYNAPSMNLMPNIGNAPKPTIQAKPLYTDPGQNSLYQRMLMDALMPAAPNVFNPQGY